MQIVRTGAQARSSNKLPYHRSDGRPERACLARARKARARVPASKLNSLPQVTENFIGWGIPNAHVLAPFVSGVEFFGGLFLLVGLCSRISAGALGITMIVAIHSARWSDVDSLETLPGLDEFEYLALFLWIAIAGPGVLSIDYVLQPIFHRPNSRDVIGTAGS